MLSPSILTNVPFYGRLHDLGCATGHHPFLMLRPFTSLVLMQLDLFRYWQGTTAYENEVYLLPKQFDVEVTSCRFSTRYGALPSLFGDRQFLEVSSLKALSRWARLLWPLADSAGSKVYGLFEGGDNRCMMKEYTCSF